jgi:hypothetical protein
VEIRDERSVRKDSVRGYEPENLLKDGEGEGRG